MGNRIDSQTISNFAWLFLNIAAVVGVVAVNKLVFTHYKFRFGTLLTVIHFVVTSVGLEMAKATGMVKRKKVAWWRVIPLSASFCGFVVLTNLSLQYNSIGFYQMAKVMTTPFLVLLQVLFYAARFTRKVLASLVVVCVGVALATATEMQLTMIGSLIAVAACFVTSVYNIWVETDQKRLGLDALQLLSYQAPLAAIMLAGCVPFFDNMSLLRDYHMTLGAMLAIAVSSLFALAINLSTFMIIGRMSAMTYNVTGHIKLCLVLLCGYLFFDNQFNPWNMLGMLVATSGVVLYSLAKMTPSASVPSAMEGAKETSQLMIEDVSRERAELRRSLLIISNVPINAQGGGRVFPMATSSKPPSPMDGVVFESPAPVAV